MLAGRPFLLGLAAVAALTPFWLRSGAITKEDSGEFITQNIPEWGLKMTYVGGAGLLAPGRRIRASLYLHTPGTCLLECYVKAPNGQWHTSMGMLHQVTVTDRPGNSTAPEADATLSVGNAGIDAPDTFPAGTHTIAVRFTDNPESFMPYDLHLARLSENDTIDEVVFWMDWSNVGGLRAPAPVTFLCGVENLPAPPTGYMTVDLEPGQYLWVSEIDAGQMHKALKVE